MTPEQTTTQRWRIYKRTGEWDDVIEGLDTGETGDGGTEVVAVDGLLSGPVVERVAVQIAAEFGYEWVFESDTTEENYDAGYWRHVARQALRAALR